MTKLQSLFGGEFVATAPDGYMGDWQLTDSQFHFCTIHDVLAHDDGKAKDRAVFIAEAVNNYELLMCEIERLKGLLNDQNT